MEKIRLGIIGLGRLGIEHAKNIKTKLPNTELYAICSNNQEELDRVNDKFKPKHAFLNYKDMFKLDDLDGIVIASNSASHCQMICDAANMGVKNIFCEKPLGMNLEEIDLIKETLEKNQVKVFQIGFNRRFDKSLIEMKERIKKGELGDIILIKMTNRDPSSIEEHLLKFSPTSGGLVFDMLTHDYDLATWLAESDIKSVYGIGGVYSYEGLKELNDIDNCMLSMEFENGAMCFMETSRSSAYGYQVEIEVFGTKGGLRFGFDPSENRLDIFDERGRRNVFSKDFFDFWKDTFAEELIHFTQCIREDRRPVVSIEEAYNAVKWAFVAKQAVDENKKIEI